VSSSVEVSGNLSLKLRPAPGPMVMVWTIVSGLTALTLWAQLRHPTSWLDVAWLPMIGLLATVWFRSFRMRIESSVLYYSAPLRPTTSIRIDDIVTAELEYGRVRPSDAFRPKIRLAITAITPAGRETKFFSVLNFRGEDVSRLVRFLEHNGKMKHDPDVG
jgi:hypothetical protein